MAALNARERALTMEQALTRLAAASDLRCEVTLSFEEADTLLRWVYNERYRRASGYPPPPNPRR